MNFLVAFKMVKQRQEKQELKLEEAKQPVLVQFEPEQYENNINSLDTTSATIKPEEQETPQGPNYHSVRDLLDGLGSLQLFKTRYEQAEKKL